MTDLGNILQSNCNLLICKKITHQTQRVSSDLYFEMVMHILNHEKSAKISIHFHAKQARAQVGLKLCRAHAIFPHTLQVPFFGGGVFFLLQ